MGDHYILERYLSNTMENEDDNTRRFSVINTVVYTEKVPSWSVEEVGAWLKTIGFGEYCDVFHRVGVDGDILLLLKDSCMKEDLEIKNGILRKRFQRELKNLKRISDYSCCGAEDTARFLNNISPDFREFTYNLHTNDMTVEYMRKLSKEDLVDMMKKAGIDNMVHQQKIFEALCSSLACDLDQLQSDDSSLSSDGDGAVSGSGTVNSYDVYLTCPRESGAELASLIRIELEIRGLTVFFSNCQEGSVQSLPQRLTKLIQNTKYFILVLVPGALDSCKTDSQCSDKLKEEIITAIQAGVTIVPVTADFQWPDPEELDPELRQVAYFNGVRWVHEYQTAGIDKLEKFIRGDSLLKVDSPHLARSKKSSRRSSGVSTPSLLSGSRRPSGLLSASNLLMVPGSLRKSNLSIISNDSGLY